MFTHLLDFILIATPKTVFKTNIKIKLKSDLFYISGKPIMTFHFGISLQGSLKTMLQHLRKELNDN